MVVTDRGIVATSHVLASQAGAQILARGGSAIDAAIAANAVLGVTEPMMNGIGGDLFLLYWDAKTGKLYGLNASGWAPQNLTIDLLKKQGFKSMPEEGIHSATVPGAVDGGRKLINVLDDSVERSVHACHLLRRAWLRGAGNHSGLLGSGTGAAEADAEAQRVFLPQGKPPALGEEFRNPDLGKTLRLLADKGRDSFYKGEIAQAILKTSAGLGGTMQASDLADFSSEWVEPISTDYRGWKVYDFRPTAKAWPRSRC